MQDNSNSKQTQKIILPNNGNNIGKEQGLNTYVDLEPAPEGSNENGSGNTTSGQSTEPQSEPQSKPDTDNE